LHDVERRFFVPDGEHRLLERALFDAGEECGELASRCQGSLCCWREMVSNRPRLGLTAPHQAFIVERFSAIGNTFGNKWTARRQQP
jgi:hypothetical protein